jgi:hypothetical protein
MLSNHASPALVSESAAHKLPRYALLLLLIAYIVPQLFSAELWSGRDMTTFGVSWTMLQGSAADWFFPNIDGAPVYNVGPLTSWIAAISMAVFGRIFSPVIAFHLTSGIWFTIVTAAVWYSTYYLARRDEAQPITFVFGGEAKRKDYGRVVADIAVLMLVATYGIVMALHEITPSTTLLALSGLLLYGSVLGLDDAKKGAIITGIAGGAAALATSFGIGLWFTFSAWLAIFVTPNYTSRTKRAILCLVSAFVTAAIWPLLAFIFFPGQAADWFIETAKASFADFAPLAPADYLWLIKNVAWATLPSWPFAIWGLYAWKAQRHDAQIAIPCTLILVALISIMCTGVDERGTLFCFMPSLVILAAFGVVSAKKSKENTLDLFSGVVFTLGLIALWVYAFAWLTGEPAKMAWSITRLAPQVPHELPLYSLIIAGIVSVYWLGLCFWRQYTHPVVVWRGAWISASGVTVCWIVAMCLFGPLLDGARTMEPAALAMKSALSAQNISAPCISGNELNTSDRAAFNYYGGISFCPAEKADSRYEIVEVPDHEAQTGGGKVLASVPGRPRSYIVYQLRERDSVQ